VNDRRCWDLFVRVWIKSIVASPRSENIDPGREGTPSRQPVLLSPSWSHLDSLRKSTTPTP